MPPEQMPSLHCFDVEHWSPSSHGVPLGAVMTVQVPAEQMGCWQISKETEPTQSAEVTQFAPVMLVSDSGGLGTSLTGVAVSEVST